jgi:anti-sigma factor (TIGR02949 family)
MSHKDCRELLAGLSEFLDDEASAELCAEIKRHMGGCHNCRVVVDTLRKTITLYRSMPRPDLPEEARERLYRVLDLSEYTRPAK